MTKKERLDVLLFDKGLAESREKARALIMSGKVYVENQKCDKPGIKYSVCSNIEIRSNSLNYVSRGGLKLKKAIDCFNIDVSDKICMDIGASTGGFTDCMLQHGAKKVYAVDVGYGQLDYRLRNDDRVINLERTNIRHIKSSAVLDEIDFVSMDVSFISICLCLPAVKNFMNDGAETVCLIKPQFEAGHDKIGKNGVVKDKKVHIDVINKICEFTYLNGFGIIGLDFSPIKGPKGNIEYLVYMKKGNNLDSCFDIDKLVNEAHSKLNNI